MNRLFSNHVRIRNVIATAQYYEQAHDRVYLCDGLEEKHRARTLRGYDGFGLCLEETRMRGWVIVDHDGENLNKPGWITEAMRPMAHDIEREYKTEGSPNLMLMDIEAVRFNRYDGHHLARAITYLEEVFATTRRVVGPTTSIVPYDLPHQQDPGTDDLPYLSQVMPALLPLIDGIGCLLYLRSPKQDASYVRKLLSENIARCHKWGKDLPVHGIFMDGYVDTPDALSDEHMAITMEEAAKGDVELMQWGHINTPERFDEIQKRVPAIRKAAIIGAARATAEGRVA